MEQRSDEEKEAYILQVEEQFKNVLSPAEPWIMHLQSLLVWENPRRSAVLFVFVHGLFWFLTCSGCRLYSTASTIIIVIYFIHTWKRKIWPEIRVPPKEPEDRDGWTPVHPRLLSVPELCKHLARGWCYMSDLLNGWIKLRRTKPLKFCILNCVICGLLALLGQYISDLMLSYIIITSILLWPCVQYHNLLQKLYLKCEPIFMKLDYSMKSKSKWTYSTGNLTTANNNSSVEGDGDMTRSVVNDNEVDLEEFMPSEDPQISAALARAITDSEDEGGSLTASTTPLAFSKEPSITGDDDNQVDLEEELIQGIGAMPSFDETLDHTDDELLAPEPASKSTSRGSSEEPFSFDPGHFDNSSASEEETVREELNIADQSFNAAQSDPAQALAESLMANALKQMVGSALQNLTGMTKQTRIKARPRRARIAYTHGDSDDEVVFDSVDAGSQPVDAGSQPKSKPRTKSVDSEEINIEEEFEFLDQYELEDDKEEADPGI